MVHYLPTVPVQVSTNLMAIGWGQQTDGIVQLKQKKGVDL
jgi:hypothetical protein